VHDTEVPDGFFAPMARAPVILILR
jgi:hypothetical protein